MRFKNTIGQNSIIQKLVSSANNGRISHAQLFYGKEGAGALALAMAYIQYLGCENKEEGDSCGHCNFCKKISTFMHPDLHFSYPIISDSKRPDGDSFLADWREVSKDTLYFSFNDWKEKIGAENKQLIIPVREADRISKKLSLKSYEGGYKFMVIWLAEYMKAPTANKLLKLIEEPPEKTLIILVTNNFENIISTILSRTQLVKLNIPQDDEIANYLENQFGISPESAANSWADKLHGFGREDLKQFLTYSLHMVRQCILGNYAGANHRKLNTSESAFAGKFAPFINHTNIIQVYEHLSKAEADISRNGYAKIVLLDTAIELFRCINPKT